MLQFDMLFFKDTHVDLDELEHYKLRIIMKSGSIVNPLETGIVLEGIKVLTGVANACDLLFGHT